MAQKDEDIFVRVASGIKLFISSDLAGIENSLLMDASEKELYFQEAFNNQFQNQDLSNAIQLVVAHNQQELYDRMKEIVERLQKYVKDEVPVFAGRIQEHNAQRMLASGQSWNYSLSEDSVFITESSAILDIEAIYHLMLDIVMVQQFLEHYSLCEQIIDTNESLLNIRFK